MSNVIYASIVLHPIDSLVLKGLAEDHCPAPEGATHFNHHLTIQFRPTKEQCEAIPFGRVVPMVVKGLYAFDSIAAFKVEFFGGEAPCEIGNPIPHVTSWVAEEGCPAMSNDLLAGQSAPVVELNELITGTVSWFDGDSKEHRHDQPHQEPDYLAQIEEGVRSRPWDGEYRLALASANR